MKIFDIGIPIGDGTQSFSWFLDFDDSTGEEKSDEKKSPNEAENHGHLDRIGDLLYCSHV